MNDSVRVGFRQFMVILFQNLVRAWRRGWCFTPWRIPKASQDDAMLEGLGEYLRKQPEVRTSLRQLGLRDHDLRALSTTLLLLDVLFVAGAVASPFLHHPERSWIGILVGFIMASLAASMVGLHRLRQIVLPRRELHLHGWVQVLGLLMTLAYIGWTIAWFT